jgi:hypothetical protein
MRQLRILWTRVLYFLFYSWGQNLFCWWDTFQDSYAARFSLAMAVGTPLHHIKEGEGQALARYPQTPYTLRKGIRTQEVMYEQAERVAYTRFYCGAEEVALS